MQILTKPFAFEWDKGNLDKNLLKHNVAAKESEEVFENAPKFIIKDETHSQHEDRYGLYGRTDTGRLLFVVFTVKPAKVRIISARDMSKKERSVYHEKVKDNPSLQE